MNDLKIRQLVFNDVYDLAAILKNLTLELTEADIEAIGDNDWASAINVIKNLIADSKEAKKEINNFLGSLFGITGDEFGNLGMLDSSKCILQFKELEGMSNFFKLVGQLMF